MKYLHVKNLEKYQPGYKDRDLIWVKIYLKMFQASPKHECLMEVDKWRHIALIMLETQIKGPVPLDKNYLKRKGFDLQRRSIELTLNALHDFIEVVTIPVQKNEGADSLPPSLHSCDDFVTVSCLREEKRREEKSNTHPTVTEIKAYCDERKNNINPEAFFDHYSSNGWRVGGKSPMKDWRAAVRNWERSPQYGREESHGRTQEL